MGNTAFHSTYTVSTNTYTLRVGTQLRLRHIHVKYTSDATVGNRKVAINILDGSGNEIADFHAGVSVTASSVSHVEFIPGMPRETQLSGPDSDHMVVGIPELLVSGHYSIQILDDANISSGDTMVINVFGEIEN